MSRNSKRKHKRNNFQTYRGKNFSKGSGQAQKPGRRKEVEVDVDRDDINRADLRKGDNDITWYTHYPILAKNVSGINYGEVLGSQIRWGLPSSPSATIYNNTVAGLASIHFVPTLGDTTPYLTNTANKVGTQLYNVMRQKLGSTASYEANDTLIYLGAVDSAFILYALGVKAYGCLRMASPFNNYLLQSLMKASGLDYQSFADNISNFRSTLNTFAIHLSSLQVPNFDIFKRHIWMITNVFTDSNTAKAQMYTLVPDGVYQYTEQTEGPAFLKYIPLATANTAAPMTFDQWKTLFNQVISGLVGSSDVQQMSADMGKAFEGDCVILSLIPEDYITPVSYSREVLSQFENAILNGTVATSGVPSGTTNMNIVQNMSFTGQSNPNIKQECYFTPTGFSNSWVASSAKAYIEIMQANKLVNFHEADISNDMSLIATRGIPGSYEAYFSNPDGVSAPMVKTTNYGTEIYTTITLWWNVQAPTTMDYFNVSYVVPYVKASATYISHLASVWSQFDWAPALLLWNLEDNSMSRLQDIDMYGLIDEYQACDLNVNAVLSEFYSDKFPMLIK